MQSILEINGLTKSFGSLVAVNDVSFEIKKGQIVSLIGPNGAGKTTCFHLLTGYLQSEKGKILFCGKDITNLKPHQIAKKGIARSFQERVTFPNLSVLDNIRIGIDCKSSSGLCGAIFKTRDTRRAEAANLEQAERILELLGLEESRHTPAKDLSYEHISLLEIAVALGTDPAVLLLDEPMMGMNPTETTKMMQLLLKLRTSGITILLVEHDMRAVMAISDWIVVLDYGVKIAEGTSSEIKCNQTVITAYLGE